MSEDADKSKAVMDVDFGAGKKRAPKGQARRKQRFTHGERHGYRKDGRCHIDGKRCERAARCNESPYLVCGNCKIVKNVSYSFDMCRRCKAKSGQCFGFECLLMMGREGGKSILL